MSPIAGKGCLPSVGSTIPESIPRYFLLWATRYGCLVFDPVSRAVVARHDRWSCSVDDWAGRLRLTPLVLVEQGTAIDRRGGGQGAAMRSRRTMG